MENKYIYFVELLHNIDIFRTGSEAEKSGETESR